ncbi:hypothetical protein [Sporosarcina sp. FSL W7-1283]
MHGRISHLCRACEGEGGVSGGEEVDGMKAIIGLYVDLVDLDEEYLVLI